MTNTEQAQAILRSGKKDYKTYLKLVNLADSAKGQDQYQCKDLVESFIASGGDYLNVDGILSDLDNDIKEIAANA